MPQPHSALAKAKREMKNGQTRRSNDIEEDAPRNTTMTVDLKDHEYNDLWRWAPDRGQDSRMKSFWNKFPKMRIITTKYLLW